MLWLMREATFTLHPSWRSSEDGTVRLSPQHTGHLHPASVAWTSFYSTFGHTFLPSPEHSTKTRFQRFTIKPVSIFISQRIWHPNDMRCRKPSSPKSRLGFVVSPKLRARLSQAQSFSVCYGAFASHSCGWCMPLVDESEVIINLIKHQVKRTNRALHTDMLTNAPLATERLTRSNDIGSVCGCVRVKNEFFLPIKG